MRRARALVLLALAHPAAGAATDTARCRTSVSVEPVPAYVGQPVLWRLEILRREDVAEVDWLEPPVFPGFRAEWLPGDVTAEPRALAGERWIASRERRVLFPGRAGRFALPDASLACVRGGAAARGRAEVRVPGARLEVIPLPEAGRPTDFDGLVGPVEVETHLAPAAISLGESALLSVHVRGSGDLWSLRPPLDPAALVGVDVFPEPPQLARDVGRALQLRRTFRYTLVPRTAGAVAIPELEIPWFDPASGGYRVARAPARSLQVGPAAAPPAPPEAEARPQAGARLRTRGSSWLAAALAGLLAGVAALWLRARRRRARSGAAAVRALIEAAHAATARGDSAAALDAWHAALRRALAVRLPGAAAHAADELRARAAADPALAAAVELAAELERARFAGGAPPSDPRRLEALIQELCSGP